MKLLLSLCLIVVFIASNTLYAAPEQKKPMTIQVQVQLNDHIRRYAYTPKLHDVLAPIALQKDWYWPATTLYKLQDETAEHERAKVVAQLSELRQTADGQLDSAINRVSYFIESWQLASRVSIPIDFDLVRIRPEFNLGFDDGFYLLKLHTRPQTIEFWGAVEQVITMPHSGTKAVPDYLMAVTRSNIADTSYVLVVQPDGQVKRVGVQSWNAEHVELMPGSSVFIPFASSLFHDLTQLNDSIARLARHRVK